MKNQNSYYLLGGIAVVGLIYFLMKKKKADAVSNFDSTMNVEEESVGNTFTETIKQVVEKVLPVTSYPLKKGSVGSNVVVLQNWLNNNMYANPKLDTDGNFGAKTEIAVINMQQNPNQKAIYDYIKGNMFGNFVYGQVSLDFFTKFVK